MDIDFIKKFGISSDDVLVVGCSAGADSMALLHYIRNNCINKVVCAHINHNVRKESLEEEEYLRGFCDCNDIVFEGYKILKYNKGNFENQAREERYRFYEDVLKRYDSKYLFLAHHGDDLVETIMMKIVRGSDLEGYAGIKMVSERGGYFIIRPFLEYTKDDLIRYDRDNFIKYYDDSSNFNTMYTRNRFRLNILPLLKGENKDVHKSFLNFSLSLLEYDDYVNDEVMKCMEIVYNNGKIDIDKFKGLHSLIKKNIIYRILKDVYGNKGGVIRLCNVLDILNMIDMDKPNAMVSLPLGNVAVREYNYLYISDNILVDYDYEVRFDNEFCIGGMMIKKIDGSDSDGNDICRINSNDIHMPLYVRNRRSGDRVFVLGLNGHKKVKDIFIDCKIPREVRKIYPLIVDSDDNIIWVPNLKKSKFNAKLYENCDIILKYCEKEENDE